MRKATLAIIIQNGKILMGRKIGSPEIGAGTLNGPGGKQEPNESLLDCVCREAFEELAIELDRDQTRKTNIITFYAGDEPSFEVHVYHASVFAGNPRETTEMTPEWHSIDTIPYDRMLDSDEHWFPRVIRGEMFNLNVFYERKAEGYLDMDEFPFEDHD